jgi:tetratricopeptide (TPR) repeat protein
MPFGKKDDASNVTIDFDAVYAEYIAPAIEEAGLEALRADEEITGGIIHKPMFERLILCEYAVADLTTANANVFYELGVRHAVRPWSTVLVFAGKSRLPFDVAPLRALRYDVTADGFPRDGSAAASVLAERLRDARRAAAEHPEGIMDSPLYQLLEDYPDLQHEKTDVFRNQVAYSKALKRRLAEARSQGIEALRTLEEELGDLTRVDSRVESGVVVDLFLSYRSVKAWDDMIRLVDKMAASLASTVMVQEQLAFALNRRGEGEEAEQVLKALLQKRGPSSETYGLLGRVYKDRWEDANGRGEVFLARGLLDKAIEAYLCGFEADWRDAYPGINAVTLMELREPPDPRREQLIPVVSYAVERRISAGKADYWDHATRLELAVLAADESRASEAISTTLAAVRERWEPETTARNLRLIREARERRGEGVPWMKQLESTLETRAEFA